MCMYVLYVCICAYICTIYQSALSRFKIKRYINLLCYVMLCCVVLCYVMLCYVMLFITKNTFATDKTHYFRQKQRM